MAEPKTATEIAIWAHFQPLGTFIHVFFWEFPTDLMIVHIFVGETSPVCKCIHLTYLIVCMLLLCHPQMKEEAVKNSSSKLTTNHESEPDE